MNKIISSYFRPNNIIRTEIENVSPRVMALMENISTEYGDYKGGERYFFLHRDIGTAENMQKLFSALDSAD